MRDKNIYQLIGGADVIKKLVDNFYDEMDRCENVRAIRRLHPKDLKDSKLKLFLFLSGWFGGPDLYVEKYGHPRLKRRHMPFSIGTEEANQWIYCMEKAVKELNIDNILQDHLMDIFKRMANHLVNDGTKITFPNRTNDKKKL
tara:strand:+ start:887 stop:1315 length:429 start_codon:yes stop_codon:yes gene_type:complete